MSAVNQRAVQIKKQLGRRSGGELLTGTGSSTDGVSFATSNSGLGQHASGSGVI